MHTNGIFNDHVDGVTNGLQNGVDSLISGGLQDDSSYTIRETPMNTKRPLRVVFMGMGCSGINFAYHLNKRMENVELVIYEKNDDIGGTWLENKYPGCACDIPSVSYQYVEFCPCFEEILKVELFARGHCDLGSLALRLVKYTENLILIDLQVYLAAQA